MVFLSGERAGEGDGFDPLALIAAEKGNTTRDKLAQTLAEDLAEQAGACWSELRQVEIILEELAIPFEGDDPLKPQSREHLQATRQDLERLAGLMRELGLRPQLKEPDDPTSPPCERSRTGPGVYSLPTAGNTMAR